MKQSFLEKSGSVAGVFVPVAIHYFISIVVNQVFVMYLLNHEGLTDMESINTRFEQQGIGVWATGVTALLTIPMFLVLMHADKVRVGRKKKRQPVILCWLLLIPFGICMSMGLNQLFSLMRLSELFQGYSATRQVLLSGSKILSVVVLGVLVPIAEELMFRGLMYQRIKELCKPTTAMVLSALLFGIYHMNFLQFLYASLIGMMLVLVLEAMDSILAPILLHGTANLFVYLAGDLTIFQKSPYTYITCIVGLIGMCALIWFYRRKNSNNSE